MLIQMSSSHTPSSREHAAYGFSVIYNEKLLKQLAKAKQESDKILNLLTKSINTNSQKKNDLVQMVSSVPGLSFLFFLLFF